MTIGSSSRVRRGRARAAVLGLLVTAAAVGLGSAAAPAGAATKTVCAAGCDYTSIAAATAAAVNGDVITVAAGTYHEPRILISQKGITLQGAGAGQTIIDGELRNDLVGGEGQIRVESAASASGPITVSGITIRNAPKTPAGSTRYAVQVKASRPNPSAITFDDVAIEGVGASDYGIYVNGASAIAEPSFTFTDGSITGTAFHAILFEAWRGPVTVEDSTFTENATSGAALRIFADAVAERAIPPYAFRRNTFTGTGIAMNRLSEAHQGFDAVEVTDNTFTGLAGNDTAVTIASSGTGSASVPTAVSVTGNTISGSGAARGIALTGSATGPVGPATVSGNSLLGLGRGIDLGGAGLTGAIDLERNRFIQLTAAVNNAASSGTVNASENWWGCNGGPGASGCSSNTGTGTTTVDSWIVATAAVSPSTVPSGGTAAVTADLRHLNTGVVLSSLPAVFNGLETYYDAGTGSVTPSSGNLSSGHAPGGTYTAPVGPRTDSVTATIDGAAVTVPVEVGGSGIRGTVTSDETGLPIAGLQVRLYRDGATKSAAQATDAQGRYTFGNLTTGSYELWFRDVSGDSWVSEFNGGGLTRASGTPVALTTGDVVVVDAGLAPRPPVVPITFRTISGRVTQPDGVTPIAGIQVRLYAEPYTKSAAITTDADGRYEFTRQLPGSYKLWFRDITGKSWVSEFDGGASTLADADGFSLTADDDVVKDVQLAPTPTPPAPITGTISGTVLDDLGNPVAGIQVRLYPTFTTGSPATTTDAAGRYTFTKRTPGDYKVWFRDIDRIGVVSEFNLDKPTQATADVVTLVPAGTLTVDATLTRVNAG